MVTLLHKDEAIFYFFKSNGIFFDVSQEIKASV